MSDGIVILDDRQVGTFEICPDEKIAISFSDGLDVKAFLEYASLNGLAPTLQLTPTFEHD